MCAFFFSLDLIDHINNILCIFSGYNQQILYQMCYIVNVNYTCYITPIQLFMARGKAWVEVIKFAKLHKQVCEKPTMCQRPTSRVMNFDIVYYQNWHLCITKGDDVGCWFIRNGLNNQLLIEYFCTNIRDKSCGDLYFYKY